MINTIRTKMARIFDRMGQTASHPLSVLGRNFQVPVADGMECRLDEPWMIEVLARILPKKPGAFIDVGMNIGQTLVAVKAIDNDREYIGFEPNTFCVRYVEKLVEANDFKHCNLVPTGLAREGGLFSLYFYQDRMDDSSASMISNFRPSKSTIASRIVPVIKFDTAREALKLDNAGILKIDVEGYEAEVFGSMSASVQEWRPWLITEILPCTPDVREERLARQEEYEGLLENCGYSKFRVIKNESSRYERIERIDKIGVHENLSWSDYICVPSEEADFLAQVFAPQSP